jgi:DNA-binding NtrC family response regulator
MKAHILAIDDEKDIREMVQQRLMLEGYRVTAVGSPEEARRIVREDAPQLIIADLQMDQTDGLVLIEELKALLPGVPIILLTGVVFDPDVIRDNISKKVSCYLDKTSSLTRLIDEVRRLLNGGTVGCSDTKPD